MTDDDYAVVQAMIIFGGSFVSALGADRRSGNGVEHAARDERRGPEVKR